MTVAADGPYANHLYFTLDR